MTDHASPLEIFTGLETRGIHERQEWDVEGITQANKTSTFLAGSNIECAGEYLGLVGHNPHGMSADIGEGRDEVPCPLPSKFGDDLVIGDGFDHMAYVVAAAGVRRHDLAQLRAWTIYRISGRAKWR